MVAQPYKFVIKNRYEKTTFALQNLKELTNWVVCI